MIAKTLELERPASSFDFLKVVTRYLVSPFLTASSSSLRDVPLQAKEAEQAAHDVLTGRVSNWGDWDDDRIESDWFCEIPGLNVYCKQYNPRNFHLELKSLDRDGENSLYIRDGFKSVTADNCHDCITQVIRLKREGLIPASVAHKKIWTLFVGDKDYSRIDKQGEEKMIELIKLVTGAIKTVYDGELVYTFAGTRDWKTRTILENAGFMNRGETPEWPDDRNKALNDRNKALFVLDLRGEDAEVKGS